jgi:hypothetical protein
MTQAAPVRRAGFGGAFRYWGVSRATETRPLETYAAVLFNFSLFITQPAAPSCPTDLSRHSLWHRRAFRFLRRRRSRAHFAFPSKEANWPL